MSEKQKVKGPNQSHLGLHCFHGFFIRPKVIKLFSCSTQLSMKSQLLIKTKILLNEDVSCSKVSDIVFIMLINVKMPTIVGILTFMSRINFVLMRKVLSSQGQVSRVGNLRTFTIIGYLGPVVQSIICFIL